MEGSGETESSKTSPSDKNDDENKNESCNMKDGGITSSNSSTVEESDHQKKPYVRPYVRSKMTRLRWTPDLHLRFLSAVERLGGEDRATPKLVLQLMNIKGLNIAHVKSHLQMYRSKKIDHDPNQGSLTDQKLFMEGADQNIYNLIQLPLLPSFNQRNHSNIRYEDSSWNGHRKWIHNSTTGFYSSLTEKILSSHYYNSANLDHSSRLSSFDEGSVWQTNKDSKNNEFGSLHKQEFSQSQFIRQNPIQLNSLNLIKPRNIHHHELKRKASSDCELDLNLSLGIESRNDELKGTVEDDENLLLSLYTTTTSSSSKVIKKLKNDVSFENARGMSTLDLTL
ncbi:hypothetical protein BUALT_Bualt11G0132400 [Buddleja alternifolia]|uniref:HTH myb-type domain-containing protein n=1 Tax=Buddleja alternifolia TaxID=168488 RepID=A0AAV6WVP8_9LAMI|nr:hypothetical protein BUALT_Bualt11G0132400 [Buddleja alternifolia]